MAFLAVRRIKYEGTNYHFESPVLGDGVNLLVGENGSGKSTFANLIYFGLGGKVDEFSESSTHKHLEITSDTNSFVELLITIDDRPYTLQRLIGSNSIHVSEEENQTTYPLIRGEGRSTVFSDWLLEKLGIVPVVLQHGAYTGNLNFSALARLIYHDQAPDPSGIYKAVDRSSFVSDSRVFRKAIFEILLGKSFLEYYARLAEFREAEKVREEAARSLELFKQAASGASDNQEDLNLVFLEKKIAESKDQQSRLENYRRELVKRPPKKEIGAELAVVQDELVAVELKLAEANKHERRLLEEQANLQELRAKTVLEATQVKKMMFANDALQLFDADTCPYCLTHVPRSPNACICGKSVGEQEYEKFFYNSSDYEAILKTKQKNVETLIAAIAGGDAELTELQHAKQQLRERSKQLTQEISAVVTEADLAVDIAKFETAENTLSKLRGEIDSLSRQLELAKRRDALERELKAIEIRTNSLRLRVNALAAQAELGINELREQFSEKFDELMRSTVKDCHRASIDNDYMPVLNGGEYKEASANVPKRLLYYGTLLYMSLRDTAIAFPRFLLIDTPETAGIDPENLKQAIRHLATIVADGPATCQVVMTTGYGRYPEELEDRVFLRLRKVEGERLLQRTGESTSLREEAS